MVRLHVRLLPPRGSHMTVHGPEQRCTPTIYALTCATCSERCHSDAVSSPSACWVAAACSAAGTAPAVEWSSRGRSNAGVAAELRRRLHPTSPGQHTRDGFVTCRRRPSTLPSLPNRWASCVCCWPSPAATAARVLVLAYTTSAAVDLPRYPNLFPPRCRSLACWSSPAATAAAAPASKLTSRPARRRVPTPPAPSRRSQCRHAALHYFGFRFWGSFN